jgi:DNA-binding transcriptional ArsR family regulator
VTRRRPPGEQARRYTDRNPLPHHESRENTTMPTAITGLRHPAPVVSPLIELGCALHALNDPTHHTTTPRAALSPDLAARTAAWSWTTRAIRATPFVTALPGNTTPSADSEHGTGERGRSESGCSDRGADSRGGDNLSFPEAVEVLRALPVERLAGQLLRSVSPRRGGRTAAHWAASRGPAVAASVTALLERPAEAVADFLDFLEVSWHEWFAAEWHRVQPSLAARARRFTDLAARHGAQDALTSLDPAITATPTGITIAKVQNTRHDVSQRGLLVAPSAFIHPHLYVADIPHQPLLLIYPITHPSAGASSSTDLAGAVPSVGELSRRLEAIAHRGRLEVARAIATEPRTAGEIAALWNVDPTLVNRHLRALAAAGLAVTVRSGRFVQYRLADDVVAALGTDLLALLLR